MYGGYQGRYAPKTFVALYHEPDDAARAIDVLREIGIEDRFIQVQSGVPYRAEFLGRPERPSGVPKYAMVGAFVGFLAALGLYYGTPLLYPIRVGGKPLLAVPPSFIVLFELTMLGMLIATFLGVFIESLLPPVFGRRVYHPEVSDGAIAVFFQVPAHLAERVKQALAATGPSEIAPAEGTFL